MKNLNSISLIMMTSSFLSLYFKNKELRTLNKGLEEKIFLLKKENLEMRKKSLEVQDDFGKEEMGIQRDRNYCPECGLRGVQIKRILCDRVVMECDKGHHWLAEK